MGFHTLHVSCDDVGVVVEDERRIYTKTDCLPLHSLLVKYSSQDCLSSWQCRESIFPADFIGVTVAAMYLCNCWPIMPERRIAALYIPPVYYVCSRNALSSPSALECRTLGNPPNGNVVQNGSTFGSKAVYECEENFFVEPEASKIRFCLEEENDWTGVDPMCGMYLLMSL